MKKPVKIEAKKRAVAAPPMAKRGRPDGADAFFPDPGSGPAHSPEPLSQELAEEYLQSATMAEEATPDILDSTLSEEEGGPFVISPASREFAQGEDASNPVEAEAEPLPSPMRGAR